MQDPPRPPPPPPALIVFKRFRYAGATQRILTIRADRSVTIDDPSGGAGRKTATARLAAPAFRRARHTIAATPWRHLSHRRKAFDGSGAYFLITRHGRVRTVSAAAVSVDLLPLVRQLSGVLDGTGLRGYRVRSRFFQGS